MTWFPAINAAFTFRSMKRLSPVINGIAVRSMPTQTMKTENRDLPEWLQSALLSPVDLFQIYRFFLAVFILFLFFTKTGPFWLGLIHTELFVVSILLYLAIIVANIVLSQTGYIQREQNVQIMIFTDILFITLIMHASGGVQTGLGILIAISITAGSLMMKGRMALLFASLATVAVITEQYALHLEAHSIEPDFVRSALLGLAFFAIALLSHSLALHIEASEELALQTQKDLDSMAQLNEYVIRQIQHGVIAVDMHGKIKLINRAAARLINLSSPVKQPFINEICPALSDKIQTQQKLNQSESFNAITLPGNEKDQPVQQVRMTLMPLGSENPEGTLVFLEDLSEVTQQAQQLKLASIGRLTASIAHEIRNPLGAISHAGQLLNESASMPEPDKRLTEIITQNSARLNQTIENVLKLSRRDSANPDTIKIKPWLSEIRTQILQATTLEPGQIVISVDPGSLQGFFDTDQVNQVLTILANNAITHFDGDLQELRLQFRCSLLNDRVLLECIDNGPGIEADNISKIFEPFYTNRNTGTGLGLYIARELLESNNAQITYFPNKPSGSNFRIFFSTIASQDTTE